MANSPDSGPINFIRAVTVLLACQLVGEAIVTAVHHQLPFVTFPGPVVGMVLFFLYLLWRKGPDRHMEATGGAILRNLSLLFVPAAVGIVQQGDLLSEYGVILVVSLLTSAILTLLVTATVFQFVAKRMNIGDSDEL
jgi:holin-like protein